MKRNVRKTEKIHNPAATVGILISRLVTGFFSWLLVSFAGPGPRVLVAKMRTGGEKLLLRNSIHKLI